MMSKTRKILFLLFVLEHQLGSWQIIPIAGA